ncbi:MAG: hypothetical protein ACR2KB_01340 [Chitinophagaceae bacterium]
MAILKAGNMEVEIRFHKYQSCGCIEYSFEPRVQDMPLINPLVNKGYCKDGKYICYSVWHEESLIPFFERLLKEKQNANWDQWPEDDITIKAETWQSRREQKKKDWEGKTVLVTDFDGELKREPYEETMKMFEPFFEAFFDMNIIFNRRFFAGETDPWESCDVCLKFTLSFDRLERCVEEMKAEYEIFKLTRMDEWENYKY